MSNEPTAIEIIKRIMDERPHLLVEELGINIKDLRSHPDGEQDAIDAIDRAVGYVNAGDAEVFIADRPAGVRALNAACAVRGIPDDVRSSAELLTWPQP